jgi:hypothetical protein
MFASAPKDTYLTSADLAVLTPACKALPRANSCSLFDNNLAPQLLENGIFAQARKLPITTKSTQGCVLAYVFSK